MDLKQLHRNKVEQTIFKAFGGAWAILIHDKITSNLINNLFKKSDLLDYYITGIFSIDNKHPKWNLPIIYFVNCTKEISKIINQENKIVNHPPIQVYSLCPPEDLDPDIRAEVVDLNLVAIEERVFTCDWENLASVSNILDGKFNISYETCTMKLAEDIEKRLNSSRLLDMKKDISLLVLDRTLDIFTPFLYFFTFRSMMVEIGNPDCNDSYYKDVRNKHLGEVNDVLHNSVKKLQESFDKLSSKNVNINELDSLVIEAPKNIELKANIEKYTKLTNKSFQKLEMIKDLAEAQQDFILSRDKKGNLVTFHLDKFLPIVFSPRTNFEDRLGMMFLLKAKGVIFARSEKELFMSKGFSKVDVDLIFNQKNQVRRTKEKAPMFDISRYEPVISDVVESFISQQKVFPTFSKVDHSVDSLRKSSMMNVSRAAKNIVVVYVNNGLCTEELKLAYLISEKLGVECIFGSNKILTRNGFINEFRTNKDLQETVFTK